MSKRVLIVDDEESSRKYLSFVLTENGYEVLFAENGLEGIDKAVKEKPDLIVLDVMMPKKSGIGALQELKRTDGLEDTPVIMLSEIQAFIKKAREEIDSDETMDKITGLLQNVDSRAEKFLLRFRQYRKALLNEREGLIDKFRRGEKVGVPVLPDLFMDKPIDAEDFIQAVKELIGTD